MDLSRNLQALEVANLEDILLRELEHKADHAVASLKISKQQVLNTYLGWLRDQFVTKEQVDLRSWIQSLRTRGFENEHIFASFKDWQRRETQDDPSSIRRYLMIEEELERLLYGTGTRHRFRREASVRDDRSQHDNGYGNGFNTKNKQRTGANEIPVTNRRLQCGSPQPVVQTAGTHEVIEIEDDDPVGSDEITITREMVLLGDSPPRSYAHEIDDTGGTNYPKGSKNASLENRTPPKYYICKRCNEPGHWVNLCPTNLNPSFDTAPDPTYKCGFCHKVGHHLATLCPKNNQDWSLNAQRKKAGIVLTNVRSRGRRRSPSIDRFPRENYDNYRPCSSPGILSSPSRDGQSYTLESARKFRSDRYRPGRADDESQKYGRDQRTKGKDTLLGNTRENKDKGRLSYHDEDRNKENDTRLAGTRENKNEGRLSYHDEDVFMTGSSPLAIRTNKNRLSYHDEDVFMADSKPLVIITNKNNSDIGPQAAEKSDRKCLTRVRFEADKFLQALKIGLDNKVDAACTAELDMIMEEVATVNGEGISSKKYSSLVLRLFKNQPQPIINHHQGRKTATDMWEELH